MPTIIDQLIVSLELDPAKFTDKQKRVVADVLKGQKDLETAAKAQEAATKKVGEAFARTTQQALGFFCRVARRSWAD